ncbi:leucine-rich repeat domain-containing protein [Saccharibacillus sacchari]|uniref:leucine-rich repeat domain-containing protein n=1 Tax=Saccharibacillus sacchari TaxID=456493 RepID=UPI0004AC772F|nr:leucine-rich repeat domain-containing protein [Saccharibacillus sacchari]
MNEDKLYEKSKQALLKEAEAYITKQRQYAHFHVPDSPEGLEVLKIMQPRPISTYAPLKEFTQLERLEFGTTDSKMTVPTLAGLDAAVHLKSLGFVSKTTITQDIGAIAGLTGLETLQIRQLVQPIPPNMMISLINLRQLSLSRLNHDSFDELPPALEELSLNFFEIERVPPYKSAPSVRKLSLGAQTCGLEDLGSLRVFPNIEEVQLLSPKKLTDLSHAVELVKLRVLDANFCQASDLSGFRNHPSIQDLRLRGSQIRSLREMGHCPELQILYAEKTKLESIEGIREQFPKLELLWIWGTKVKDLSPLEGMTHLKNLDVTMLKPKAWDFLLTLTALERLDLSKTSFSDPKLLLELPALKWVRLSGSQAERGTEDGLKLERLLQARGGELVHR